MCGRFSQAYTWEDVYAFSQPLTVPAAPAPNLQAHYNLSPTNEVDVIVWSGQGRALKKARWGLVPPWHKGPLKGVVPHINARLETIDTNKLFNRAFVKNRCIIPASGFYEWTGPKEDRIPHFISHANGTLMAFAGIWERWRNPETGEEIVSCSIITREANTWMSQLHDRMPAMLHPADFDHWLQGHGGKDLLMQPPPEMREWIVHKRMNRAGVGDDDPATCAPAPAEEPVAPEPPVQGSLI
ncbi:SOS response-associated peptidase [Bosea sp. BK604]|uniref:SOS response-associated peptidase n=1 Tax=Bosea sp. BK604 TaxID=2512180 RepID=UPI00105138E9|nr:SOS response-associated peptidase [Bosea sp. BK604]TCR65667.1 putative SOS response-associated peptidase YedK [Bosea sp. BK604]